MLNRNHTLRCVLVVLLCVWGTRAEGATFFVSVNHGDDANPGTEQKPWKTIKNATESIQSGDAVVIHGGIYRGDRFRFGPAGKNSKLRTVFRAHPGERVLLTRDDGTVPGFALDDSVRVEELWIGGRWTKEKQQPIFAVGGSPIGRSKQVIGCTIFGYAAGILVGSSEDLLIQNCRIVHCGNGRFSHGCYLSGGYTKGAMTQHVILDNNVFVAGEGYAIHGWHNPHSCIITRNFVSGFFWDVVMSGSDHLVAHNTLWRNTGQKGRERGWNAWLPAKRVLFANNILNSKNPIFGKLGEGSRVSHNAYLSAKPPEYDGMPLDLRTREQATNKWIERIDQAIARIDATFDQPVDQLYRNQGIESVFAVLGEPPPIGSRLHESGMSLHRLPAGRKLTLGRTNATPVDFWAAFDKLGLRHFNRMGRPIEKEGK